MTQPLTYPIASDGPLSSPASGRGQYGTHTHEIHTLLA